jgi:hypothetical protein
MLAINNAPGADVKQKIVQIFQIDNPARGS